MPKLESHGDGVKAQVCASYHLTSGLRHPESGNLASLPQSYLVRQLHAFKSDGRHDVQAPKMKPRFENLTVADMVAILAHVGTLDPNFK